MTVPPVSNQWQRNCNCTTRLTHSLFLPTQAYSSSHFYTARLAWFPGHMDWELRKRCLGNTRANSQHGCSRSEVCTMCIPSYKNGGMGANFHDSPSCTAWEHSYQIMYTINEQRLVYLSSRLSVIQLHSHQFPESNRRYGDSLMTVIV